MEAKYPSNPKCICTKVFEECASKLSSYNKTKSVYNLLTISTTKYIQKMRFNGYADDENTNEFYQTFQKLHLLKSICYKIYIRNMLTDFSYELLASAIPIITFIGLVSSISNYGDYNTFMIRVLFATSISVAAIPFLLLFISYSHFASHKGSIHHTVCKKIILSNSLA